MRKDIKTLEKLRANKNVTLINNDNFKNKIIWGS